MTKKLGLIGHVDHGKTSLTSALVRVLAHGIDVRETKPLNIKRAYMPDDLVVVLNRDADEAGDYRVLPHCEAVNNPNWTIMHDMVPSDLD